MSTVIIDFSFSSDFLYKLLLNFSTPPTTKRGIRSHTIFTRGHVCSQYITLWFFTLIFSLGCGQVFMSCGRGWMSIAWWTEPYLFKTLYNNSFWIHGINCTVIFHCYHLQTSYTFHDFFIITQQHYFDLYQYFIFS